MFSRKQQQVVAWTSTKTNVENANKQYAEKVAEMAAQGYTASAPLIGGAGRSKKSWLALGVVNFARSKQVVMTAIFTLVPPRLAVPALPLEEGV